jgi:mannose-6-phosphate isomerase-like protein (cupin superfamily)
VSSYKVLKIDKLDRIPVAHGLEWRPIRRRLGIRAFGMNAYTAEKVGDLVVEEHKEGSGHEEVYVVVSGHARFTIDGQELDAPAGTIVYLPEPGALRSATSQEEGTTVLAVGGWPDKAFEPSGWEWRFEAEPLSDAGKHDEALAIMQDATDQFGESPEGLYHIARFEARAGRTEDATAHIERALERKPEYRQYAEKDEDLAPLLGDG